jgi:hypothetical protein
MNTSRLIKGLMILGVAIFQVGATFLFWALSLRIHLSSLMFRVMAFPMLNLCPWWSNEYFWLLILINSLLWASVIVWLVGLLRNRGSSR